MKVKVLLFARLRELAAESVDLEVPEGATVADVWRKLQADFPSLAAYTHPPLAAVEQEYAAPDTPVLAGKEIAFFPPVSGG